MRFGATFGSCVDRRFLRRAGNLERFVCDRRKWYRRTSPSRHTRPASRAHGLGGEGIFEGTRDLDGGQAGPLLVAVRWPDAVIAAIDSDRDSDGIWYESWVITLTVIDADRALVRWLRMVNNTNLPLTNPSSRFSYQGVGVLQRGPAPLNAERAKPETIGELLSALCDGGDAKACHTLARAIDNDDPTRAGELRKRACDLGDRSACEAR